MSLGKFNPRTMVVLLMILLIAAVRFIILYNRDATILDNFSPVGAMALFGGAYFSKNWKAFSFPLLTLFASDVLLSFTIYNPVRNGILYGGWYWVYGAFILMVVVGRCLLQKVTVKSFLLSTLICVLIHWIVTDFGVWYGSKTFTQDLQGYLNCLVVAIPFEWRFFSGTLVYGGILFGSFKLMEHRYTVLKMSH